MKIKQIWRKTMNCRRKYGLAFTLRQISFIAFHGPNPMTIAGVPQSHEVFLEHTRKPRKDLSAEEALDLQYLPDYDQLVINLILDRPQNKAEAQKDCIVPACRMAVQQCAKLRIITRLSPADVALILKTLQENGCTMPEETEFFSDYMRDDASQSHTPLLIGRGDRFYNASLQEITYECMNPG